MSQSEYQPGYTIVVAPVHAPKDSVCRGICLIGFSTQIKAADLSVLGARVRATALTINRGLGGAASPLALDVECLIILCIGI